MLPFEDTYKTISESLTKEDLTQKSHTMRSSEQSCEICACSLWEEQKNKTTHITNNRIKLSSKVATCNFNRSYIHMVCDHIFHTAT